MTINNKNVALTSKTHSLNNLPEEKEALNETKLGRKYQGRESILSSKLSLYIKEAKPKIPDGGWGWWVVFSVFILNVISEGVCFTFGLLYIEFLEEFGASQSVTSWIGSLFMAIPLLAGPLGSALVDKYGCKYMTILGGVICTIGFFFSAFANSIGVMYLTFGIIGGIGRCLTYVTAVVAVAFWFEKRRSAAYGLSASGAGIGTITFAPLSTFLINRYGWRGTVLILAGIFANFCVCGVLMRDPDWIIKEEMHQKRIKKLSKNRSRSVSERGHALNVEELRKTFQNGEETKIDLKINDSAEQSERFRSMIHLPTFQKQNKKIPLEALKKPRRNEEVHIISSNNSNTNTSIKDAWDLKTTDNVHEVEELLYPIISEENQSPIEVFNETEIPLLQKNALNQNKNKSDSHSDSYNFIYKRNSIDDKGRMLTYNKNKITAASCPDMSRSSVTSLAQDKEKALHEKLLDILKVLTYFSLFLELHFLLMALATINLFIWFIVPYFYLAEHMVRIGYTEEQASTILSIIGLTNTIGMVILGWAGDRLNVAKTYAVCLILCGLSVLAMMFFTTNYTLLMINCGLFGLFFASCFSLSPSLIATLVPLDDFTKALGLSLLCEGIGNLTGPPLAGFIFDITQSWDHSFYQAGFWIIISGIMVGVIPYTNNKKLLGSGPIRR